MNRLLGADVTIQPRKTNKPKESDASTHLLDKLAGPRERISGYDIESEISNQIYELI